MGWKCFILDGPPRNGTSDYQPGAMWIGDTDPRNPTEDANWNFVPSIEYLAGTMKPWWIALPGPSYTIEGEEHKTLQYFALGQRASGNPTGWVISGKPPNITITPSIDCVGRYHGFVRDGIITPDCEGRLFPHFPETV